MLNSPFCTKASILRPCNNRQVTFTGDKNVLEGFYSYGINNKDQVLTDQYNFKRPEIDEKVILNKLLDSKDPKPVLITGKPQSGKSVVAGRMIQELKDRGHKVFVVENDITSCTEIFDQAAFKTLTSQINELNSDDRVYLFVDEPQFISGVVRFCASGVDEDTPEDNVLAMLSKFVADNKNVKLVGIMYDGGFTYGPPCNQRILKDMFPEKNHIAIPEINKQDKIDMINTILKIAGFNKIPVDVANRMKSMPLEIRETIEKIFRILARDCSRVDDINKVEDIKPDNWRILMSQLQDRM